MSSLLKQSFYFGFWSNAVSALSCESRQRAHDSDCQLKIHDVKNHLSSILGELVSFAA
ncbi:hypothetical protein SynBIOSE41_00162 [Synechococcus sp. BIOS-E4-1]|nr:hypothetical protein SynBIOSE41_00162 [Synechococcus sp. BIOS-E4-1]